MSSSSQRDGWLRISLVFMVRRRVDIASLPLLSSSTRARAREDAVGEGEGGGSGPNLFGGEGSGEDVVGKVVSGDEAGLGNQVGSVNRPSKG